MSTTIDVQAATKTFLAQTEGHLSTYLEACVHCGMCAEACHFHQASGDPRHTPAYKLFPIAKAYKSQKWPLNWLGLGRKITEKDLAEWEELLFDTCTMCGRCTQVCPMGIDIASIVGQARKAFAAAGLGPDDLQAAAVNSRDNGSPLGLTPQKLVDRLEWLADDEEVDIQIDKKQVDVLLTVSSIEAMKYPQSLSAMAKIMNHAGVSWTFSTKGYESTNFGYLAGKPDIAKIMIERLLAAAEATGAKTVIIPECGHAYGVLRWGAANMIGRELPFEVLHITEYMAKLKREGRIKLKPYTKPMTYHDPCQVSRRGGATEDARYLLEGFATDFREMSPTGNNNWCCGGGGGVQAMSRAADLRHKVFKLKMDQVEATGTKTLVSACANCRMTMDESKTHMKWDGGLESLVELIAEHLDDDAA
ncbi:MAG: succinate dehydrogenase/fumarate reductase iron-sulfur subunit [Alphaproteobacteria bacterium ADurb.BinA280]|jgi:Fe-S oxidoreductase|nr:(Fe-S)-binding protein [Xanthomonadales bacterium]MCC6507453.1 (Fe-S)-binding protein [Aquimonas sp.]OPZ11453.1 MAG: succinate dehydrogenase/fumarate reductase iron-sulfur subunit [Alphaproteobacteria bacterium ADurb.BinA280]